MNNKKKLRNILISAGLFIVLTLIMMVVYLRVFPPLDYVKIPPPFQGYDAGPMQKALSPESIENMQAKLLSFGSRFLGSEGMYRTEAYIRETFEKAGLDIHEMDIYSVAPSTDYAQIFSVNTDGSESELTDVHVYPFMPNHLQPPVTPAEGLEGTLLLLDSETLKNRTDFTGCIGLIDSSEGNVDETYGFDWVRYARLGLKALIVAHPQGLAEAPWKLIAANRYGMVASIPVNYVRLAATPEIFRYKDKKIRLHVKTRFKHARNTMFLGVLRAKEKAHEAMLMVSPYDTCSILPDLAPGALQTINPAISLQTLEGLQHYTHTMRRDVIFLMYGSSMMANDAINHLIRILHKNHEAPRDNPFLAALGIEEEKENKEDRGSHAEIRRLNYITGKQEKNLRELAHVQTVADLFENPEFLSDAEQTETLLNGLEGDTLKFFDEQFMYVMNTIAFELSEPKVQAKIIVERDSSLTTESPEFKTYFNVKKEYDDATSTAGYKPVNLLRQKPEFVQKYDVRGRTEARFRELLDYHLYMKKRREQEVDIIKLISSYEEVAVFEPKLMPALPGGDPNEVISFNVDNQLHAPALASISNVFSSALLRMKAGNEIKFVAPDPSHISKVYSNISSSPVALSSTMWVKYGYPVYTILNFGRSETYANFSDPVDQPFMTDLSSLKNSLALVGEAILSFAHGNGRFEPVDFKEWMDRSFGGRVLVSGIGQSIVPNYPLKNAVIMCHGLEKQGYFSRPGYYAHLAIMCDVYGKYSLPRDASNFPNWHRMYTHGLVHSPLAAGYGENGLITYMKDEGEDGQRLFKSVNVPTYNRRAVANMTIVTFRASPVSILDLTNPQTMKDYARTEMITTTGLTPFRKRCPFVGLGLETTFLEPDQRFYVKLMSGAPENELSMVPRAFMLGIHDKNKLDPEREIDGEGYLVSDTPFVLDVPIEVAESMVYVNSKRLELQDKYGMADERTKDYHEKAVEKLKEAEEPGLPKNESLREARSAVTYATLNHPVLRESVAEAVLGILWYLALLVPFVFFFEKLVFCFPDVRKQIAAQVFIFLTVFLLLRFLHPAFLMVRSSLMILLGFVIILISGGITVLFSSKFRENLEELRKKQGKISAAEVNTLGVMGTAFMLGLNNMHRRKVRTGLTCATLTLITFVMICFTSVQNNLVEESSAIGKASYQGMLIKRERFIPLTNTEVLAFKNIYGEKYDICQRKMLVGIEDWRDKERKNPELAAETVSDGAVRRFEFDSILQMSAKEPLRDRITILTGNGWFTPEQDVESSGICPVLIPDSMADELGISVKSVNEGNVLININGTQVKVHGIFSADSLNALRDMDGMDLLPFDIENMAMIVRPVVAGVGTVTTADEDDPRIPAQRVIITPVRTSITGVVNSYEIITSVAVSMPGESYRDTREVVESHMEKTSEPLFYGLDGIAYKGRRAREFSMEGLLDLLIPLIIAGLTVLNTMKGSVYERKDEIFVYNAVGIAPRYVFFMFFAEAFVYAVVGSVLGYLLSQGTGKILTAINFTGGLNMTFTSVSTIYASLTIAAATFASTYFPAKSAMEISAPAEDAGWSLPEPKDNLFEFDLPFNFRAKGRIAVLSFFERYLLDHGEGSAGRFFTSDPVYNASMKEEGADTPVPSISTTVWLKPFDLAVSQEMVISIPHDPETGLYKAHISLKRLSGSRDSWIRLNKGFVALIRRHFLHWRAVSEEEAAEMFEEARRRLYEDTNLDNS